MTYYKFYMDASNIADKIRSGEYKQVQQQRAEDTQNALIRRPQKQTVQEEPAPRSFADITAEYLNLVSLEDGADYFSQFTPEQLAQVDMYGEGTTSSAFTKPTKTVNLQGKEDFMRELYPTAVAVGKEIGVDPRIILAQAALETGWGKSAPGNNFFGIKSHGVAGGNVLTTKEVIGGKEVTIQDSFRTFASPQDSVRGYGEFLKANPRYAEMLSQTTLEDQVAALQDSGYATDPDYGSKVYSIAAALPPLSDEGEISFVAPRKNAVIKRKGK